MKLAYSFLRWSQKDQNNENRDSRRRQTESAEKWIVEHAKKEYELSKEIFIADGQSAYKGKHIAKDGHGKATGELMRFIQKVESGEIKNNSILLIDSIDRFTRLSAPQALNLFSSVLNTGIGLVFTGSHEKRIITTDLLAREPHILYFILGEIIRANSESAEKGRKIKSSRTGKLKLMNLGVKVPHNNLPKFLTFNKLTRTYEFNEKAEVIKELFYGALNGKSLYSMADDFNKRKIKTLCRGLEWRGTNISSLIRSRTLIGEFLGLPDYLPALIDKDQFEALQNILNSNKFNKGKRGKIVNIFRGVAFCECGRPMSASSHFNYNTPLRYLRCPLIGKNVKCECRAHIYLTSMEQDFFSNFLLKSPDEILSNNNNKLRQLDKTLNAAITNANKLQALYDQTLDLMDGDALKNNGIKIKLLKIESDLEKANDEKDKLILQKSRYQSVPESAKAIIQKIGVIIDFDNNTTTPIYNYNLTPRIKLALNNNETREKVRVMLPNVIGKMVVNTKKRQYFIFNHIGNLVYTSRIFHVQRNTSPAWLAYMEKHGKNKTAEPKTVKETVIDYIAKL